MLDTVKSEGNHWNRFEMNPSILFGYKAKVKGNMCFAEGVSKATSPLSS